MDGVPIRRRLLAVFFVALGAFTVLGLGWSTLQSFSGQKQLDGGDVVRLSIMTVATLSVVAQAFGVVRALPGVRWAWLRSARLWRRFRGTGTTKPRFLLNQVGVGELARKHRGGTAGPRRLASGARRFARWSGTGAWIASTLVVIALAGFVAVTLLIEAVNALVGPGRGVGLAVTLPLAAVVGTGVARMSLRLVKSWFLRRHRHGRRLLARLSRYLLRWVRVGTTAGRPAVLTFATVTTGAALVGALAFSTLFATESASAAGTTALDTAPNQAGEMADLSIGSAVTAAGASQETLPSVVPGAVEPGGSEPPGAGGTQVTPVGENAPPPARQTGESNPAGAGVTTTSTATPDVSSPPPSVLPPASSSTTLAPPSSSVPPGGSSTTTSSTTTTTAATTTLPPVRTTTTTTTKPPDTTTTTSTTTTTAPPKTTTTTTTTKPPDTTTTTTSTTTTTTTVPPDTTGPQVKSVSANPEVIFTNGTEPDAATITATATDPSGVAQVTVYYRTAKTSYTLWGIMKASTTTTWTVAFGPFGTSGTREYRIVATDTVGNTNCSTKNLGACPGGFIDVILP